MSDDESIKYDAEQDKKYDGLKEFVYDNSADLTYKFTKTLSDGEIGEAIVDYYQDSFDDYCKQEFIKHLKEV